jgi:hypothetical protein
MSKYVYGFAMRLVFVLETLCVLCEVRVGIEETVRRELWPIVNFEYRR